MTLLHRYKFEAVYRTVVAFNGEAHRLFPEAYMNAATKLVVFLFYCRSGNMFRLIGHGIHARSCSLAGLGRPNSEEIYANM